MARPVPTSITCPVCGQPFSAILERIVDAGMDPTAKERLLSGRVNLVTCPHCGYRGMVGTPLMYHDPAKKMAIIYVPMELNLQQTDREKLIGDLTNAVIRSLPEEAPKGYLLQPGTALTLQGLIDQVLEAEGVTQDMIQAERRKVELVGKLAEADAEERERLLEENQDLLDLTFLELITAAAQAATQAGDQRRSLRLLNIRQHLMDTTEAGQTLQAQQDALDAASQQLKSLGDGLTRERFVDLIVASADDPLMVDAYATLGRQLLDYTTFQNLTSRIESAASQDEKNQLSQVRDRLLEISAEYEKQARAVIQRAADTLQMLLTAPDVSNAIRQNLDRIDDTFLQVLQVNLEEARRSGNVQVSTRLKEIRDEVLNLIQAAAPPEIQFINDLLSVESEDESLQLLRDRQSEISQNLVEVMSELADQLRMGGNEPAAQRLDLLRAEAEQFIS